MAEQIQIERTNGTEPEKQSQVETLENAIRDISEIHSPGRDRADCFPVVDAIQGKSILQFQVSEYGLMGTAGLRSNHERPPREIEIQVCMGFLETAVEAGAIIKTPKHSTYQLKHVFQRRYGYTTNGAMIVACHRLGIPLRFMGNLNPGIGIRERWFLSQMELDRNFKRSYDDPLILTQETLVLLNRLRSELGLKSLDDSTRKTKAIAGKN